MKIKKTTEVWLEKVAKKNNVSKEDVLRYLDNLSRGNRVIHHLKLA